MRSELDEIAGILKKFRKVAVVGLSPDPDRPSHEVAHYLMQQGYEITGVRPGSDSILGRPCYASVSQIPGARNGELEIVDVFRAPEHVPALVDELIPLKPKVIWLQDGVANPQAEEKARKAGIQVVSNRCMLRDHARLNT